MPQQDAAPGSGCECQNPRAPLRYVARQPILDVQGRLFGYELLFRSGPEAAFRGDGEQATCSVIDNTLLSGMDKLTGGLPAFINCTAESLTAGLVGILPAQSTVLEILETIEPTPQIFESCRQLKAAGFRLALDDFVWNPRFEPLLEIADFVKVDFMATSRSERRLLRERIARHPALLLAEKIETQEDYRQARTEGFSLFQGYYFCRPELIKSHRIPANRLSQLAILALLRAQDLDMREIAEQLKQDAALTFRLLRLVNSPIYAMRQEVRSIDTALLVAGEEAFRKVAMLAIASELGGNPPMELLRMAIVRGRFCEMGSPLLHLDSTEQYLLGLLSLLPAMLCIPMKILSPTLPLRDAAKEALLGCSSPQGAMLRWIEGLENGDWTLCDQIAGDYQLAQEPLLENYASAVLWSEAVLSTSS